MTFKGIRDRVRLLVPEATTTVISDANLNLLVNDGALDVVRRTDCLVSYADQTVTASTQEYSLPTLCLRVLSVYYGGTASWEKLPCVSGDYLGNEVDEEWLNKTGTTYGYYLRADKIGLYYSPTSAEAGTDYLRVYFVKQPAELTLDSDIPFDSQIQLYPYHDLIVYYAMYKVKQLLGKWEQAKVIETDFITRCREMRIEVQKMNDFQQVIRPYYRGTGGTSLKQNPLET